RLLEQVFLFLPDCHGFASGLDGCLAGSPSMRVSLTERGIVLQISRPRNGNLSPELWTPGADSQCDRIGWTSGLTRQPPCPVTPVQSYAAGHRGLRQGRGLRAG